MIKTYLFNIFLVFTLCCSSVLVMAIEPVKLRTNDIESPLGIDCQPVFSWQLKSVTRNDAQSAYEIMLSTADGEVVWNTGIVKSTSNIGIEYSGPSLTSRTEYLWKVRLWDKNGDVGEWSETARFETAFLSPDEWKAQWVEETGEDDSYIKAEFVVESPVKGRYVTLTTTRLGLPVQGESGYRLQMAEVEVLNGDKIISKGKKVIITDEEVHGGQWAAAYITDGIIKSDKDTQLGATTSLFANASATVTLTIDLGKDEQFDRVRLYPRQDTFAASDNNKVANFPTDFSITIANADKTITQTIASETSYTTPERVATPETTCDVIIFAKDYNILKPVRRARVYASGLGVFELRVNGSQVTNNVLEPGESNYDKSVLYATYDITHLLNAETKNRFTAHVGGAFWCNPINSRYAHFSRVYGRKRFLMQVHVEYEDGTEEMLATDDTWQVRHSATTFSSWYGGEDYNATIDETDEHGWAPVRVSPKSVGRLRAQFYPPIRPVTSWKAVSIKKLSASTYIVDFGTNFAGTYRFKLRGTNGKTIRIYPTELLNSNSRQAQTRWGTGTPIYDCYTFAGNAECEEWGPRFIYHGFRYLEISGLTYEPKPEDFTAIVIRSGVEQDGKFACDHDLFNKIHEITLRAIESNLYSTLTDCPHREKLGWLEVPGLLFHSLTFNYDLSAWSRKVSLDARDAQYENGFVPNIAPEFVTFDEKMMDDPSWNGTTIMLPYRHYLKYGNIKVLQENYNAMRRLMAYYETRCVDGLLSIESLGDWGAFDGSTSVKFVHNCTYYAIATAMSQIAKALGHEEDATIFSAIAARVKEKTNTTFYRNGVYDSGSQSSYALPLFFGLVEKGNEAKVAAGLAHAVIKAGGHITTGEVGLRPLFMSLAMYGYNDMAIDMFSKTSNPSYGYFVANNATSLPEFWDMNGNSSHNHCMLGHIEEWLYTQLGGIRANTFDLASSDYTLTLQPFFTDCMNHVNCSASTPYGDVKSEWHRTSDGINWHIDVPVGTFATVIIPANHDSRIYESGMMVKETALPQGIIKVQFGDSLTSMIVASGSYDFSFTPSTATCISKVGSEISYVITADSSHITIISSTARQFKIYSTTGILIKTIDAAEGVNTVSLDFKESKAKSIYIIDGMKICI